VSYKVKPITQTEFDYLGIQPDWKIIEVGFSDWQKMENLHRKKDTFAVFVSGCYQASKTWNDIVHVAGADILAYEG
jgi:hypothetical protein